MRSSLCSYSLLLFILCIPATHAAEGPAVSLLPSGVRANLNYARERTEEMSKQLGPVITDLQTQFETYQSMSCEGAGGEGCQQIKMNIARKFTQLVTAVSETLPEVEKVIQNTLDDLGKRLSSEVGRKMTPREVQRRLAKTEEFIADKTNSRATGGRLGVAGHFKRLYQLVSSNSRNQDPMLLSAGIYQELKEAAQYVRLTRIKVDAHRIITDVEGDFLGGLDSAAVDVVNGVKALLYGEVDDADFIPEEPPTAEESFQSPYERN